jgi:hypothetical protein
VIPLDPPDHTRSDDATFLEGVFVESHDRTIHSLDVYVIAAAEQDVEGCKAIARQILQSVAPGKKKPNLAAGERRLFAFSDELEISVKVPMNMVATKQDGPDFLVHRLISLGRLEAGSGSIDIYVGNHPGDTSTRAIRSRDQPTLTTSQCGRPPTHSGCLVIDADAKNLAEFSNSRTGTR